MLVPNPDLDRLCLGTQRRAVPNARPCGQRDLTDHTRVGCDPGFGVQLRCASVDGQDQRLKHDGHRIHSPFTFEIADNYTLASRLQELVLCLGMATQASTRTVEQFMDDPIAFFGESLTQMHSIARNELEELQRQAMAIRFQQHVQSIEMVRKLAHRLGITEVNDFDDVVPLMFSHAAFKSYRLRCSTGGATTCSRRGSTSSPSTTCPRSM